MLALGLKHRENNIIQHLGQRKRHRRTVIIVTQRLMRRYVTCSTDSVCCDSIHFTFHYIT